MSLPNYSVDIRITNSFKKSAKKLHKKYPSLKRDIASLQATLIENPEKGILLGNDAYKIRLRITSKGKGKSGGGRVITYVETEIIGIIEEVEHGIKTVNLLYIYDKSETETITQVELKNLIKNITNQDEEND